MATKIIYSASGRPNAVCPYCEKLHPIIRRAEYRDKQSLRFRCSACKRLFYPSDDQAMELRAHFQAQDSASSQAPPKPRKKASVSQGSGRPAGGANPIPNQAQKDPAAGSKEPKKRDDIWSRIAGGR